MPSIVIGSVNCRGLADSVKGCDIFTKCKDLYDVTVLVNFLLLPATVGGSTFV